MKYDPIDPDIFIYLDLIGRNLHAKHKTHPHWTEFRNIGTVVSETKNTLKTQNNGTIKIYVKEQYIFRCWIPQERNQKILLEFDGTKITGNPEQRIKNIRKKYRRKLH
jgi:RNase P/RNase MRP subunit p29